MHIVWASDTWWNNKTQRREDRTIIFQLIPNRKSVFSFLFFSLGKHHLFRREVKSPMAGHPVCGRKYCSRSPAMYVMVLLSFKVSPKTKLGASGSKTKGSFTICVVIWDWEQRPVLGLFLPPRLCGGRCILSSSCSSSSPSLVQNSLGGNGLQATSWGH